MALPYRAASLALLTILLCACAGRGDALRQDVDPNPEGAGDASTQLELADRYWQLRRDRRAVDRAIALWEEAAAIDPSRGETHLRLSQAYYWLAHGILRWEGTEEEQEEVYDKGVQAGERAIRALSPEFARAIREGGSWERSIDLVDEAGAPALYWYAVNLGRWALLRGIVQTLHWRSRIAATMEHCLALDETYFYAAPHRYFGVYRTRIPFPRGDLDGSREHFERAVELAPDYLENKVLFAGEYATRAQEQELFERLLREVLATPDDVIPELVPETRNAKRQARDLLDRAQDYF